MSFLIRRIEHTADGREIVRESEVAGEVLTIGRAAENDIALPDLAVNQQHARISPLTGGQLRVAALGTLGFTIDGRNASGAVVDPEEGAELGFGTYRLALQTAGDGRVAITVTQVEDEGRSVDNSRRFSLASALPGKRPMAWASLAVILVLFLAIPVVTHLTRERVTPDIDGSGQVLLDASWRSGPLSLAHHGLEDNCEACHTTPFVAVRDETCLTCHEDIGDHADGPRLGFAFGPLDWGDAAQWKVAHALGKPGPGACTDCHTEHEGKTRMEPPAQQFCVDCHGSMDARLEDTVLANAADFGTSHPEFRPALLTRRGQEEAERISLAEKPEEWNGLRFPHKLHLEPEGGVARMAMRLSEARGYGEALECASCHRPGPDRVSFLPIEMERDCESCHSLVYDQVGGTFRTLRHGDVEQMRADLRAMDISPRRPIVSRRDRPGAFAEGGLYYQNFGPSRPRYDSISNALSEEGVCGECHMPTVVDGQADVVPVRLASRYLTKGWFDHDAHRQEDCAECHKADASERASDLLLPGLETCRTCHEGEDAHEAEVPSTCAMCHSYHPHDGVAAAGVPRIARRKEE